MMTFTVASKQLWCEKNFATLRRAKNFAAKFPDAVIYEVALAEVYRELYVPPKKKLKIKWSSLPEIDR